MHGVGFLAIAWLAGLVIFAAPFVLANNGSGAVYGVVLDIAWTVGVISFWIKVGAPAAREEARWESLQEARKQGRS